MAESTENIVKSCENPKENGVKLKENGKTSSPSKVKLDAGAAKPGKSEESSKSIISRKTSPIPSHKSLQKSGITKASSHSNHVAPKSDGKPETESKGSHETPSKDRKKDDGQGELSKSSFCRRV
jgi:hypothetical protein